MFGKLAIQIIIMLAAGTAAFIPAFKLSGETNASLIYAAAPFIAAELSWICIRAMPTSRVIAASVIALFGVFAIVWGSLSGSKLADDVLALFMTSMMARVRVVCRKYLSTIAAFPAGSTILGGPTIFLAIAWAQR